MHRIRILVLFSLLLCGLVAGCGGTRDKGKYQDFDRPQPSKK
jgi:hypothetical protein